MFLLVFLFCSIVSAADESLHHINNIVAKYNYAHMCLKSDHNIDVIFQTRDCDEQKIISLTMNNETPLQNIARFLTGGIFYYCEEKKHSSSTHPLLYVSLSKSPQKRILMRNIFSIQKCSESFPRQFSYVQFYLKHHPTVSHDCAQKQYDRFVQEVSNVLYDAPFKIPLMMHFIWITDPKNSRMPQAECFDMLERTMQVCQFDWRFQYWVNKKEDHSALIEYLASRFGQRIMICELQSLLQLQAYQSILPLYMQAFDQKNFGMASDIGRIAILHQHGGVYCDTDFEFLQDPKKLNQMYNFYCGFEDRAHTHINNAMIASSKGHTILNNMILALQNPISIPQQWQNHVHRTLFHTGPFALTKVIAEFLASSENGNDVLCMPNPVFYFDGIVKKGELRPFYLGRHGHFKEWILKEVFK